MIEKELRTRMIQKHDIEVNWEKAINFIPKKGELIVYDPDENYNYSRVKIGDGISTANELPFIIAVDTSLTQTDIVDNLVTNVVNKPLSAAQGVVLKNLIDSLTTSLSNYLLYYSSLFDAVTDINNGVTTNSTTDLSAAKVMLTTSDTGRTAIILLDDISETSPIDVYEDIDLVLNGKTLTFTEPSARLRFLDGTNCTINGEVEGSKVIKSSTDSSTKYMIVSSGESLYVKGGTYVLSGNFDENILCMGVSTDVKTFRVRGCTVNSINTSNIEGASRTRAIQAVARNSFIEDSTILADGMQIVQAILAGGHLDLTNSRVNAILRNEVSMLSATAVYNSVGGTCVVNNCKLHGDAPFDDADHPCADGMRNFGTAILNNTDVTGTISGFSNNSNAQVYVNGGIFTGYSHGGFYLCHGADGIAYINDALIRCGNYDGIFDYSGNVVSGSGYVVAPLASMYVGGGENENNSNITAYMDGCTFDGPGSYSLVLRGNSGETGITVNISNSAIANGKLIRVDNSTHKLRVGFGNGFTSENIDHPLYSEFNNYLYRKLYHASKCNGKDYETLYQHYIQLCEQSTNNTELILISSTEGSTKKFKLTIGDDGVLTATEIVE